MTMPNIDPQPGSFTEIRLHDTTGDGPGIKWGSADPEGSVAAAAGSLYFRTNGSVYKKSSGSGDTGWEELTGGVPTQPSFLMGITVDGGGSGISTGIKGRSVVPRDCTINQTTLLSTDASATNGFATVDIGIGDYSSYPTVASIVGANPPVLLNTNKYRDATMSGWSTTLLAGQIIEYNVTLASGISRLTLALVCQ